MVVPLVLFLVAGCVDGEREEDDEPDTSADATPTDTEDPGGDTAVPETGPDVGDTSGDTAGESDSDTTDGLDIQMIAYEKNQDIYIANADGSGEIQLTDDRVDTDPAWSPNGGTIVYASRSYDSETGMYGDRELWTVKTDGTGAQQLFADSDISDIRNPDWSPDGSTIAFQGDHPSAADNDILLVGTDGSSATPLVNTSQEETAPAWTPDGDTIVYKADGEVRKVPSSGGASTKIAGPFSSNLYPSSENLDVSPSGDKVVFAIGQGEPDLYTAPIEGSGTNQITANSARDYWPSISSDGKTVIYQKHIATGNIEDSGIYTVGIDGGTPEKLFDEGSEPAYSP